MAEKYKVIADKLELELKAMRSEGKTKLPSEEALCALYSCSRQTIRKALDVLARKDLIIKRCGAGSYIAGDTFKSRQVFFVTEDCDRYQSPYLIKGLKEQLGTRRYELKCFSTCGRYSEEAKILSSVLEERPAVLIIEPSRDLIPNPNMRIIEEIGNKGIPVIFCNSSVGSINVAADNKEGGKKLTKHLSEKGHRNIACIFRPDSSSGRDRYSGYIDALLDADAFDESRVLLLTYEEEKEILSGKTDILTTFADNVLPKCDAVICQDGLIAFCLINLLSKRGSKIPVACFDNGCFQGGIGSELILMSCDVNDFSQKLAKTVIDSAEGKIVRSVVVPQVLSFN